jgi:GT2 family glycosyltransferase
VVANDDGLAGLQLVFWLDGLPLGRCEAAADDLPLSTATLASLASAAVAPAVGDRLFARGFEPAMPALDPEVSPASDPTAILACGRPLASLRERLAGAPDAGGAPPDISVVVCTRDRPQALARCLESLRAARPAPREILVVDNAPTSDATQRLVAAMPDVRYVRESRPGLSIARNTGVRETTGAIVAFTDDDVVVDPCWIARLAGPFDARDVMAVTGVVFPGALEGEAQRMAEDRLWGFAREFRRRVFDGRYFARMRARGVPVWHIGAGANMAIRREAFTRVGLFDERLGAGAAGCSEDSELWYRLLAEGWRCVYEPAAAVSHFHRDDFEGLRAQWHAYMRGHVTALLVQFARYRDWGNLRRIGLQLPFFYLVWLRDVFRRGVRTEGPLWWAAVSGSAAGVGFYLRHRGTPPVT